MVSSLLRIHRELFFTQIRISSFWKRKEDFLASENKRTLFYNHQTRIKLQICTDYISHKSNKTPLQGNSKSDPRSDKNSFVNGTLTPNLRRWYSSTRKAANFNTDRIMTMTENKKTNPISTGVKKNHIQSHQKF